MCVWIYGDYHILHLQCVGKGGWFPPTVKISLRIRNFVVVVIDAGFYK